MLASACVRAFVCVPVYACECVQASVCVQQQPGPVLGTNLWTYVKMKRKCSRSGLRETFEKKLSISHL